MSNEDKTGGYYWGTGRRKTARASVRLRPGGSGAVTINDKPMDKFFGHEALRSTVMQALKFTKLGTAFDVFARVEGGGAGPTSDSGAHVQRQDRPLPRRVP